MKTIKFSTYIFLVMSLVLTSCSDGEDGINGLDGEDGITGLSGQDGIDGTDGTDGTNGADGTDGTNGADGTDGTDGNANVISSNWIPNEFSTEELTITSFDIIDPAITQEITDSAVILAYGRAGTTVIASIPITIGNQAYYFGIFPDDNIIRFFGGSIDGIAEVFNIYADVRYVIIPAPAGKRANFSPEDTQKHYEDKGVDFSDYKAVAAYFNLDK